MNSCTPFDYSYFPAQRKIDHKINICDTVYLIFPYSSFRIITFKDADLAEDSVIARSLAEFGGHYITENVSKHLRTGLASMKKEDRDSLKKEFEDMTKLFYYHRRPSYYVRLNSTHHGYGLILDLDWQVRDYAFWLSLDQSTNHGLTHEARGLTFYYLCLIDLSTGKVLYYKYFFSQFVGGFNDDNEISEMAGLKNLLSKNLKALLKGFLRKNNNCN